MKEDFEGSPPWFDRFLQQLNRFKDQVETIVDRRITVNDNMAGEIKELEFNTGTDITDVFPVDFKSAIGKPSVVLCGAASDITAEDTPVPSPRLAWKYEDGQVIITGVGSGDLQPNKKYRLRVVTFA